MPRLSENPYAPAEAAGIKRLSIPTPFAVGRVNLFLIEDDPLTLVDAGPNSGTSFDELERQLRDHGRRVEDIERIVVTHQHIDHIGLVQIVANRSGAEVVALDELVPFVENYSAAAAADDAFAAATMHRHGIPDDVSSALQSLSLAFRAWGARAEVTHVLHDGGTLDFAGRSFGVHFRPGHSPTDTIFLDADRAMLVGGDHLLAHISSNPLMSRRRDGSARRQALVEYLDSLRATRELDIALVLPGHGDPIDDHRDLIDARLRLHERRAEKLYGLIAEEPRTAYELAQAMWGNVAVTQAFLTLSEVLGHTDLLVNAGRVTEVLEANGTARFETV